MRLRAAALIVRLGFASPVCIRAEKPPSGNRQAVSAADLLLAGDAVFRPRNGVQAFVGDRIFALKADPEVTGSEAVQRFIYELQLNRSEVVESHGNEFIVRDLSAILIGDNRSAIQFRLYPEIR